MEFPIYKKYKDSGNPTILRGTVVPNHYAEHNKISWATLSPFIDDGLTLEQLTSKLPFHGGPHGHKPKAERTFILYCCDNNWLRIKKVAL